MTVTIELNDAEEALLNVLARSEGTSVQGVIIELIDHAQQGVYRPGSWERDWLIQVFGESFTELLEPSDPYGRPGGDGIFQRPKPQPCPKKKAEVGQ